MKTLARIVPLLALAAGCSSGGSIVGGPAAAAFAAGDAFVQLELLKIDFGPGGAPAPGRLEVLDDADRALAEQEATPPFRIEHGFRIVFDDGTVDLDQARAEFDLSAYASMPAPNRVAFALAALVVEGPGGGLVGVPDLETHVEADATDGATASTEFDLARAGRIGLVYSGITFEYQWFFREDGLADVDLTVRTNADSPSSASNVLFTVGGQIVEELGPIVPNTEVNLFASAEGVSPDDEIKPTLIDHELGTADFGDPSVTAAQSGGSLLILWQDEPVGFANEGVSSVGRELWDYMNPGEPLGTDEVALVTAGGHHLEAGRWPTRRVGLYSRRWQRPQPVHPSHTTYRAAVIGTPGAGSLVAQTSHGGAALVAVGSWGISIANYDETLMALEDDVVVETGNMTDVAPFDGDPSTGQAVYVDNGADEVKFVTTDAQGHYMLDPAATLTSTAWPGASGAVVSAFRHSSGDLLIVTDGAPGELWVLAPGETVATKIGSVRDAPRTVRAAGNVAAVGAYGGAVSFGGLSLFVRSAAGSWGFAPFSRSGARSVGIDAKELPDGRVAVASASYLGHELIVTVLDGDTGEILDDDVFPLPEGCLNPGHCAFADDPDIDAVFVSCHGSGNVALRMLSFDE